ncbi:DUF1059 domain-containing protein [Motilibacter deserti]|uniref:DUF1059 domain-containing protein n=1 Tax=Motilibacter deserti TaxID=2714956 RepID=A0ABX0GZV8_9ACTN|nr:DUF1059 domain-containing protein [Motilibacter deserti]NHC15309.1 DUF1059 domain-containing protein [Motilibacter deserti]
MKRFACGDVVPGCDARFTAPDEGALFTAIAAHAAKDHGLSEIPAELVAQVRRHVVTV